MLISILRTIAPAMWGSFIVCLLGVAPVLKPLRADLLAYGDLAVPVISAFIIGAWYALWRWLEPKLPDWLTRAVLGSAKAPVYAQGRHEAITQDDTDDSTVHSGDHEPTRAAPERYAQRATE
ncbi:hypothetical protein [Paeniglutamicibacter kerguelensis]|uniref:Uncharacterized protein n=1 Tax=Paeniglutamicibacter kerguelensis TaxID=254788 RepID=A0ABS4XAT5_9MICC|nr:hypothetical protein [Paeniglutamicibacter kerguelensis]MBP2385358.1 hypothetical protein [Paeniglutamicibacter kerguelensis]